MNFSRGRKSDRESRVIISYTGFLSFHFSKRSVHPARDVVFVCIYTYMFRFVFSLIEQAFLASIIYCISMDISEVVYK